MLHPHASTALGCTSLPALRWVARPCQRSSHATAARVPVPVAYLRGWEVDVPEVVPPPLRQPLTQALHAVAQPVAEAHNDDGQRNLAAHTQGPQHSKEQQAQGCKLYPAKQGTSQQGRATRTPAAVCSACPQTVPPPQDT